MNVSPSTLSFTAAGPAYALNVAVSQSNNSGGFAVSGCTSIVSTGTVTGGTLTVTPQAAGTCTLTVAGSGGQSAAISVQVTTTILNQQ